MRRLTCLLLVGVLVLVLSSVALAKLPEKTLDIYLTVHPHAEMVLKQTSIQLDLYDDNDESDYGYTYFSIRNNTPIDIDVKARPFYRRPDLRNLALEYELEVYRWVPFFGYTWWQCSTESSVFDRDGKFSKDFSLTDNVLDDYRVKAWAKRTDLWWLIEAG
ncbi:MAG: hypothetical protein GX047_11090, partial [Firmicutes bacterium]|nr:hypothetical protein [Bacillota bacterium]